MASTKFYNMKKLLITLAATSILALPIGCSKASNNPANPSSTPNQVAGSHSPSPSTANTQNQDQDLTKKLTSEKIVESGQVYLAGNDDAVAVMIIKKGTDEKTTKDLATKYANTMKQKYAKKKINSHAFIEGKEIAHITL